MRWEGGKGGRVMRWQGERRDSGEVGGGRFLVLFKGESKILSFCF